jgi:multidrug efflux system membrane fusion protein
MSFVFDRMSARGVGAALGVLVMLMTASSCVGRDSAANAATTGGGSNGAPAVPVVTALVIEKSMSVNLRAVGNAEAASTVEVRSQVTGALLTVGFTEGDDVKAGQLLFSLDARPFEVALRQAEAALARDTAQAKNAEAQRARLADLFERGLTSRAEFESAAASAAALAAATGVDAAQVESARLNLQYTKIAAPVSGRTGALLVHPGALVRPADVSPLVVINQISPVYVSFAVPARSLGAIRAEGRGHAMRVEAVITGSAAKAEGTVSFIDNTVDSGSDTVRLKATFPNTDRRLWPGQLVEVTLQLAVEPHAIVVPANAVQPSQQGAFCYVVKSDQTVEARPVTIARTDGDWAVVASGLKPGETVVTDGQLRLTPGARVSVKPAGPNAPAAPAKPKAGS